MLRITKKEAIFFEYFAHTTEMAIEAAEALEDMLNNFTNIDEKIKKITDIEHECDLHAHKILKTLNAAFITPIDREDIVLITKEMDDIVDEIEEVAHRFRIYNIKEVRPEAIELTKVIVKAVKEMKILVGELVHLKSSELINEKIIEINRLENIGDDIYRGALTKLFAEETDPIDVFKWNGIYVYLEKALDACEHVANMFEGVVMKHA